MGMARQSEMVTGADIYIRSHTHIADTFPDCTVEFDIRSMKTFTRNHYHVSAGNWLDTTVGNSYAEEMELPPLPLSYPVIQLSGKDKQVKVVTN